MKRHILSALGVCAFLLAAPMLTACGDDDTPSMAAFDASKIKPAPDFTDPRDGTVYKTVQIGQQIWMAENLRYALPGYSLDGAFTWDEAFINRESIRPDDEALMTIIRNIVNDPQYNGWMIDTGTGFSYPFGTMVLQWLEMVERGDAALKDITSYIRQMSPAMGALIDQEALRAAELPSVKAKVGKRSHDAAEAENGGYTARYGYLYSFSGAQAAVPEGWRLPTDADWQELERNLGLSPQEAERNEAWRGEGLATLLSEGGASGFNALRAGGNAYTAESSMYYLNKDRAWYFWTSTKGKQHDSIDVATIRIANNFNTKVWRGTSRIANLMQLPTLYSVRCVKDAD